jgi:spermidine/putrescine transport system substrate-binding protein
VFFPDGTTTTTAGDTTTPTTAPAESGEALRLLIPPDSIADEVFAAAATSIGLPVVVEVYVDPAFVLDRLNAQQGTYAYDLIVTPGAFLPSAIDAGLVQRLDPQLLPSVAGQLESVRTSPFDPDGLYSVCKEVGYTGYAWDRQVLPDGIASWEAFLEAAARDGVSGRVTGLAEGAELAAIPTWARGERTPADFDIAAAEQELTEVLLSHLADLDSSPSARMLEGEVALAQMWNGEGRALVASDPDRWGYAIGGPVTGVWMERFVIPVGAPNVAAAHAFIETMLQPEVSLSQVDRRGYNTGVASIQDTITTLPGADLIPTGEAMFGDSKDYGESLLDASYADLRGLVVGVMTDVLDTAATEAPTTTPPVEPPASDPPTTTDGTPPVTAAPTPTTVQVDAKGRRVLRPQDTGPEVAALQERLKALGFSVGRADGQFGDVTLAAVLAFQRSQGLQTDGVVGRFTWDALENPKPIVSRSPNTRGAQSGAPSDAAQHAPRGAASGGKWTKAVVYLDSFRSEFYDGNGNLAATFPNSPGVNGLTPTGTFRVYSRSADTYYSKNPAEKMKWMVRFNGGIGFHSVPRINDVPEPTPLGQAPSSHGCIRHADENAKAVFDNLVDGATVIVRHG